LGDLRISEGLTLLSSGNSSWELGVKLSGLLSGVWNTVLIIRIIFHFYLLDLLLLSVVVLSEFLEKCLIWVRNVNLCGFLLDWSWLFISSKSTENSRSWFLSCWEFIWNNSVNELVKVIRIIHHIENGFCSLFWKSLLTFLTLIGRFFL